MMMKKMLAAVMALTMSLTLGACTTGGGSTTAAGTKAGTQAATAAGTQASTTAAGTTAATTPATQAATTKAGTPQLSGTMKIIATNETYMELFNKFSQESGVQVVMLSMSSGEALSKLRAEGGTPSADLWFGGGNDAFMAAKADGLLEQVNFAAAKDLAPRYKDKDNYWFSKGVTIVGFLVNNKTLKELKLEAPTSWKDLIDPKYKGEVIMSSPAVSGTNYAVVNSLLQTMGETAGWKYFEDLNKNIDYYGRRGSDPLNKVVTTPEYAIGISYIDKTFDQQLAENDASVVYPTDGIPWGPDGLAVFKNAENAAAAKYFIEWLFSNDENLVKLAQIDQKTSVKLIKPSLKGVELDYDPATLMDIDLTLFGTQRDAILKKFEPLMGDKVANE